MVPVAVAAREYAAGYWLTICYEGSGNIANPFRTDVTGTDGQWWVLVATF